MHLAQVSHLDAKYGHQNTRDLADHISEVLEVCGTVVEFRGKGIGRDQPVIHIKARSTSNLGSALDALPSLLPKDQGPWLIEQFVLPEGS